MKTGIYQIRNIIKIKRYIGSAMSSDRGGFKRRERDHYISLCAGHHHSIHLQRAWDKYGADAFVFEVIEYIIRLDEMTDKEWKDLILEREQYYLDTVLFASCNDQRFHELGYNICRSAQSVMAGRKHTDATKRKISQSKRGKCGGKNHPMYGKKCSAIVNLKNRKAHEKLTEEQVIQIKAMLRRGIKQYIIATKFQVSQSTISLIKSGRIWSHVAGGDPLTV